MNHLFCLTYINNTVKGEANRATKGSWKEGSVGGVKNKNQKKTTACCCSCPESTHIQRETSLSR